MSTPSSSRFSVMPSRRSQKITIPFQDLKRGSTHSHVVHEEPHFFQVLVVGNHVGKVRAFNGEDDQLPVDIPSVFLVGAPVATMKKNSKWIEVPL